MCLGNLVVEEKVREWNPLISLNVYLYKSVLQVTL